VLAYGDDSTANVPATAGPKLPASDAAYVNVEPDGTRIFKSQVAAQILQMLTALSVIYVDSQNAKLDVRVLNDPRPAASDWANEKLAGGSSVLFGSPEGITSALAPAYGATGVDKYLKAETSHAGEIADAGPDALPYYAVLARPSTSSATVGPTGLAFIALGVGVFGYYLFHAFGKK
jgi:hypothetical protein